MITTKTPPLASFGFFNSRAAIDFGQRIKQAVLRKSPQAMTRKEHEQYAERERARYRKPQRRRPHSKGE
jgi:hypothetical protein